MFDWIKRQTERLASRGKKADEPRLERDTKTGDAPAPVDAGHDDEPDWEEMSRQQWEAASHDPGQDYAEAYADVAGDATLSWRLEDEDPRDILDDVRREATGRAGLLEPEADYAAAGTIRHPDQRELFITALTAGLAKQGFTVREISPQQDNAPEHGFGR